MDDGWGAGGGIAIHSSNYCSQNVQMGKPQKFLSLFEQRNFSSKRQKDDAETTNMDSNV